MNKKIFASLSLAAATAVFANSYTIDKITVTDDSANQTVEQDLKDPVSPKTYTKRALETFGKQTNTNVFSVIDMDPSVIFSSVDAFGSNESSYHDPLRIRGKNQSGPGGVVTIDGIPISGNPGGGKTIYDMENFSSADVYKGYVPVDKSLGFSNLVGKIDMTFDKPKNELGGWSFTPSVKYTDKRYGDIENKESVPGYTLIDFDAAYTQKKLLGAKEGTFRLTMMNLTNQKYISSIITPDNAVAATTNAASYQTGAPFGVYANVNFKF